MASVREIKIVDFILALLLFLSSVSGYPLSISYGIIVIIGLVHFFKLSNQRLLLKSDYYLAIFIVFSLIVFYYGKIIEKNYMESAVDFARSQDLMPSTVFMLGTIFFSRYINENVLRVLLYFIIIESIIAILEFVLGIPYIITPSIVGETGFGDTEYLYYNRVYGLSPNVSILAQKVLIGIILVFYLSKIKYKMQILALLVIALIISFGRSAILSVIFFFMLLYLANYKKIGFKGNALMLFGVLVVAYYFLANTALIEDQFFRGKGTLDVSSRDLIFPTYISYIENNFLFGNLFEKVYIEIGGKSYHAHNSFLETVAIMGVLPSLFFFYYIFKRMMLNKKAIPYLLPFLFFSFFQYALFWGASLIDVVFYFILFNIKNNYEKTTSSEI